MTGSGIGLHIVKEYVDLMGGTIRVTDNVPHGTVMMVVLPHTRPLEPTVTALAGQTSEASDAGGEARYTVLIVEDNADLRQFITDVLDEEYATLQAGDGVEAMEILAAKRVNMVISDIMMPRMDGMQLCQRIKTDVNLSHIPVMMLTAKTADEHVISGYREGADDYITKPFNPAILKLRIRKIFDWMEAAHEQMKDPETSVPDLGMSEIDRKLLERATQLVESHLADYTFSVEEFSAEMGMSRSALYKKLMALTGRSPLEFMRTIKLRQGYSLLMKGEGNVSEIAYRIGLSPKQFAHFFKEIYGVLPSKVRNGKS
jgi:DNA-binding response OmpR family regulator